MKSIKKIVIIFSFFWLFLLSFTTPIAAVEEKFVIDELDITIDIHEDGHYHIEEKYLLDFHEPSIGIYRNILTDYVMEFNDKTRRYYFPITNIKITENYNEPRVALIQEEKNGVRLTIGGDNYEEDAFIGEKRYEISYDVHASSLNNGAVKEGVFYNLLPNEWGTYTKRLKASVNFPKSADFSQMQIMDCNQNSENFNINIEGNTAYITNNDAISSYCGVTIYQPLPDDYYIYDQSSAKELNLFKAILPLLTSLIIILLIKSVSKASKPIIEQVSFKPPQGFNSAMVGYVYNEKASKKDLFSLLFEWANKEYILIEDKGKNNLIFTKQQDIDLDAPDFERQLFKKMFKDDQPQNDKTWNKRKVYNDLVIASSLLPKDAKLKELSDKKSVYLQFGSLIILFIGLAFSIINIFKDLYYRPLLGENILAIVLVLVLFVFVFGLIYFKAYHSYKIQEKKQKNSTLIFIAVSSMFIFISNLLILENGFLVTEIPLLLILLLLMMTLTSFIMVRDMRQLTDYGTQIYGEVQGLHKYIKLAKEDELLAMQEKNPHLYYDVLPYAFVFGISDLWIEKFKNIKIPDHQYYRSYRPQTFNNYYMMNQMMRSFNRTSSQIIAPPAQPLKSGTGGGNFTFGGGGGSFSGGGGFGGGGGGSR